MAGARCSGGVLVVLMGVAGLVVALTSAGRANPLWQVWAALAVSLCCAAGLVALHGRAQWRELAAIRPLDRRSVVLPTAVLVAGVVAVVVLGEVLAARPGAGWRGDVLVLLAVSGGAWAGAAMFGVRHLALTQPSTTELAGLEASVVELVGLRRRLQRLASGLGALVALSTLALGAGLLMSKNAPRELVVVFGGGGSATVGLLYAPAAAAIRTRGEQLVGAVFSGQPADRADLVDRAEQRAKLEQAIGVDRTLFGELQVALPVLGPLIAAAAVFLPR
ncbi:hypothetical protein [Nocardia sp. NRRL S-836]|uniref:hypothetical protein n=1 Tax=Nocardia sp. NRRL S-836 TaxID=1519492 RepID=UPI0006AF448E|nr:hypothetical protein [Nocardia sp. NRRL S-836]KOV85146.1 hypothetical protein ADL03_12830 [Nocardia sp. NRRL S-836]